MNAREVALHVVRDVFPVQPHSSERGAQEALEYRAQKAQLDARDRAFCTNLAFGAMKMRRALDWYLQPYVGRRDKPVPPVIAEILRLAVYELKWTATADRAVVSEWVELAKRYGHRGTAGLVNAVLRSMLRDDPKSPEPADFEDADDYLGTRYSYPTWIVRQWRTVFGDDRLEAILEACNAAAQIAVTVNRAKTTREELREWFGRHDVFASLSRLAEDSLLPAGGAAVHHLQSQAGGAWWLQSESSAAVVDVLNPQSGETIADACSGRGNKALQIAARLGADGSLICIERDPRKAAELEARALAADFAIATIVGDATAPILQQRFDRILIDAPCSGVGVLGRHPEARWRKRPDDGERLALTQRALLAALVPQLFSGGTLIYAVCSTDPRETTDVVDWCALEHNVQRGLIPAALGEFQTEKGDVLIPPGLEGRDGFFSARLERGL